MSPAIFNKAIVITEDYYFLKSNISSSRYIKTQLHKLPKRNQAKYVLSK